MGTAISEVSAVNAATSGGSTVGAIPLGGAVVTGALIDTECSETALAAISEASAQRESS